MSPADGRTAGITKFLQISLYDPFLVVLFTKVLSLLKSLHNIPGSGLLSLNIVSPELLLDRPSSSITKFGHQFSLFQNSKEEDSLPINCIFVSFMNIRNPWRGSHDMVLNTGRRVVIGIRIMHCSHTTNREIAMAVKQYNCLKLV